jgi:RNA polymerase sigma-70 factor (ECF subfamily)
MLSHRIQESVSIDERAPDGPPPVDPAQPACQEADLLAVEERGRLRALVMQLPAEQREVVLLHDFEDLSYDEIARIAGVPYATVFSRRTLAIRKLRACWDAGVISQERAK